MHPMFKSPEIFFSRLSEVEKARIRGANEDRLDFLFRTVHRPELIGSDKVARATFDKACAMIEAAYAEASASDKFGRTWAF
jgi:hypothetical protein